MDAELYPLEEEQFEEEQLPVEQEHAPEEKQIVVLAEGLSKHFKGQGEVIKAVNNVSFAFTEGQFVAIMGPSGCGKSTLLHLLGGLEALRHFDAIADAPHVDLRRGRSLARMEAFRVEHHVELAVMVDDIALSKRTCDDFHEPSSSIDIQDTRMPRERNLRAP